MPNYHKQSKAYNQIIDNIQDYMLSNSLFNRYPIHKSEKTTKPKTEKKLSNRITIREFDQLFWYFYIAKEGYDEYQLLQSNKFTIEKTIKIDNIGIMRKNNSLLKQQKLKISDYESTLLNSKKIDIPTLCGLSVYNKLNIFYIKNKTYHHFNFGDPNNTIIIYHEGKNYSCEIDPSLELIESIKNNYFYIENSNKPLKGISTYKIKDIIDICKKLDIKTHLDSGKMKNKKILYTEIQTYF